MIAASDASSPARAASCTTRTTTTTRSTSSWWTADVTAFSDQVVSRARAALEPARDAERAVAMSAYMRDQFLFLGTPTPPRRRLQRAAWKPLAQPTFRADVLTIADRLWALP